jgi:hypothetical protein
LPGLIVIHVLRPYANEDEYLAHESFSISAKSMLLIEQAPLPAETDIVFDVSLANGQKLIRAEGKVIEHVAREGSCPAGLRVRFKRFGAATKAFIDRAVARNSAPSVRPEMASVESFPLVSGAPPESSGVHIKTARAPAVPVDREALLARLRRRRAS